MSRCLKTKKKRMNGTTSSSNRYIDTGRILFLRFKCRSTPSFPIKSTVYDASIPSWLLWAGGLVTQAVKFVNKYHRSSVGISAFTWLPEASR